VADPNATLPHEAASRDGDTELLREILCTLNERESAILTLRFGLKDGRERTLEEIGEKFGVTRERIRQIQELALKKLRNKMEERDLPNLDKDMITVAA
jgi:RNA polymerase primary sigma factor